MEFTGKFFKMKGIKLLFLITCLTSLSAQLSSESKVTIIANFEDGSNSPMNIDCEDNTQAWDVEKYEDDGTFEKPEDANDYFMTHTDEDSCVTSAVSYPTILSDDECELQISLYTRNGGDSGSSFSWSAIAEDNTVLTPLEDIDGDTKTWTDSIIKLEKESKYKIIFRYKSNTESNNFFFAIDNIILSCLETTTTVTSTTTTTSSETSTYSTSTSTGTNTQESSVSTETSAETTKDSSITIPEATSDFTTTEASPVTTEAPILSTDDTTPATESPVITSPESDDWQIIAIVFIAISCCFIVFTIFLTYFYFSTKQREVTSKVKDVKPVETGIPRIAPRKEPINFGGSVYDMYSVES